MKHADVNTIVANGADAIFRLKEVLKLAGWVVTQSSDGSTFNAAGDQISQGGSGAGGMSNALAWFDIQEPEVAGRTWSFQTIDGDDGWRIKLSVAAEFTGGTPGISEVGSATDEQVMSGGGTDAAPTGSDNFGAPGTYRFHCVAQDVPIGPAGNRAYGFVAWTTILGTGVDGLILFQDPMEVGTYPVLTGTRLVPITGEADPCIYAREFGTAVWGWATNVTSWARNNITNLVCRAFAAALLAA